MEVDIDPCDGFDCPDGKDCRVIEDDLLLQLPVAHCIKNPSYQAPGQLSHFLFQQLFFHSVCSTGTTCYTMYLSRCHLTIKKQLKKEKPWTSV